MYISYFNSNKNWGNVPSICTLWMCFFNVAFYKNVPYKSFKVVCFWKPKISSRMITFWDFSHCNYEKVNFSVCVISRWVSLFKWNSWNKLTLRLYSKILSWNFNFLITFFFPWRFSLKANQSLNNLPLNHENRFMTFLLNSHFPTSIHFMPSRPS